MNFSAAHFIPKDEAGKCKRVHGHTYFVNLTIVGNELDDCGFLIDFKTLKDIVHGRYDHTLLNDHPEFKDDLFPTTEIVAETIYKTVAEHLATRVNQPKCVQVIVRETPTSYVVYRPVNL
jgi:6-pyruvoyltetrahydropterin/6-carboxytetrahydropterin synthase